MPSNDHAKFLAAQKALEFIEPGMVVGLGTGTTADHFIKLLGERVQQGLKIRGIPSSNASRDLAISLQIPIIDFHQSSEIDLTIDGADEIAPGLALIKGGGGALLREKINVSASKRFIVIADSTKLVSHLGKFPLPIEVIPEAIPVVARKLLQIGIQSTIRRKSDNTEFITDEANRILDCHCGEIKNPDALAASIRGIVGVVEHGLFLHMAERALVSDGKIVTTILK